MNKKKIKTPLLTKLTGIDGLIAIGQSAASTKRDKDTVDAIVKLLQNLSQDAYGYLIQETKKLDSLYVEIKPRTNKSIIDEYNSLLGELKKRVKFNNGLKNVLDKIGLYIYFADKEHKDIDQNNKDVLFSWLKSLLVLTSTLNEEDFHKYWDYIAENLKDKNLIPLFFPVDNNSCWAYIYRIKENDASIIVDINLTNGSYKLFGRMYAGDNEIINKKILPLKLPDTFKGLDLSNNHLEIMEKLFKLINNGSISNRIKKFQEYRCTATKCVSPYYYHYNSNNGICPRCSKPRERVTECKPRKK